MVSLSFTTLTLSLSLFFYSESLVVSERDGVFDRFARLPVWSSSNLLFHFSTVEVQRAMECFDDDDVDDDVEDL